MEKLWLSNYFMATGARTGWRVAVRLRHKWGAGLPGSLCPGCPASIRYCSHCSGQFPVACPYRCF